MNEANEVNAENEAIEVNEVNEVNEAIEVNEANEANEVNEAIAVKYVDVLLPLKLSELLCYRIPCNLEDETAPGVWVEVPLGGHQLLGIAVKVTDKAPGINPEKIRDVASIGGFPRLSNSFITFLHQLAEYYMCSAGEVFKAACPISLRSRRKRESHKGATATSGNAELKAPSPLSPAQATAKEQIEHYFSEGKCVLLNGVTGSGKTEIYIHLAKEILDKGSTVLYLVPEIAVSRQLEERLSAVFGNRLLTFHSGQTTAQRRKVFESVCGTEGPFIVLGTRSAVLLPFSNLSLVIIDEEHDSSYKQEDPAPRYNGRDAAVMLASITGAKVLMGSATPSYETLYNVSSGKYREVVLSEKFHRSALPDVTIIDMGKARRLNDTKGIFSKKLINEINATLSRGEQAMIFHSRRAYSTMVQCTECGYIPKCTSCNVSLNYHKFNNSLECHYCGYKVGFSKRCPECSEYSLSLSGCGTEKVEEELKNLFPDRTIARFDADTTGNKVEQRKILRDFAEGRTDILVGTQMITKGFDFGNLTLVAVIGADALLSVSDFRADEKAIQLLKQLLGRAGRREKPGKLLIQTYQNSHPVYDCITGAQEESRRSVLMSERRTFRYPPFVRLIVITVKDSSEGRLHIVGKEISRALTACGITDWTGPLIPAIDRIGNKYISQFWVKLPRDRMLSTTKRLLSANLEQIRATFKGAVSIAADVDPY